MSGILYSKTTWLIAIAVMAATFSFQLGEQYTHARSEAAGERLEQRLAQWDAKYHEDEAEDCASASAADQGDGVPCR